MEVKCNHCLSCFCLIDTLFVLCVCVCVCVCGYGEEGVVRGCLMIYSYFGSLKNNFILALTRVIFVKQEQQQPTYVLAKGCKTQMH